MIDEPKPRHCPNCRSVRVARVIYGLYEFTDVLKRELAEGKYLLGGCILIPGESPKWACGDCFHKWGTVPSIAGRGLQRGSVQRKAEQPRRRPRRIPTRTGRLTLQQLGFSTALRNCLECEGIYTAFDLCSRTAQELLEVGTIGKKRVQEVREKLAAVGLRLQGESSRGGSRGR